MAAHETDYAPPPAPSAPASTALMHQAPKLKALTIHQGLSLQVEDLPPESLDWLDNNCPRWSSVQLVKCKYIRLSAGKRLKKELPGAVSSRPGVHAYS
jgi:hypothetical protein